MSTARSAEKAVLFACEGETLVGVLALPAEPPKEGPSIGFIIVVGGPQYRGGSHRQFVQLSRDLAAAGHASLRFDVRGMGDSSGEARSFESITADIGAAVDTLASALPQGTPLALWGLCDGASAALLYLDQRRDTRIQGLCLLNPWVRSAQSQAATQVKHYYADRLRQREFWVKLISGRVALSALGGLLNSVRAMASRPARAEAGGNGDGVSYQDRMARGWNAYGGATLVVLSGEDYTAKEFIEYTTGRTPWQRRMAQASVQRTDLPGADHTFSDAAIKARLAELIVQWARQAVPCAVGSHQRAH